MNTAQKAAFLLACLIFNACGVANKLTGDEGRYRAVLRQQSVVEDTLRHCILDNTSSAARDDADPTSAADTGVKACTDQAVNYTRATTSAVEAKTLFLHKRGPSDVQGYAQDETARKIAEMRATATERIVKKQTTERVAKQREEEKQEAGHVQGTAFAVTADGLYLTSDHVIAQAGRVTVTCANNQINEATVSSRSQNTDLALLHVNSRTPDYLSLAPLRSAKTGQHVFTIGFPLTTILGREAKFTDGAISALSGINGEQSLLQISVPVQPGNSGGPLINDRGEVVGVVAAQAAVLAFMRNTGTLPQNVNWAVKSDYAATMFDAPQKKTIASSTAAAVETTRRATCLVDAWKSAK